MNISSTNLPQIYRQSLVRRPFFSLVRLLVRPWPYRVAPAAGESFGAQICPTPCSLCHFMPSHVHPYPHGPPANVATLPAPINCMETRCSKVIFPNYPKKKPVKRYARTAAMGNTGKKMFVFLGLFVHAAVRGRTCAFTSKTVNTLIKNSSRDDRPSIST